MTMDGDDLRDHVNGGIPSISVRGIAIYQVGDEIACYT